MRPKMRRYGRNRVYLDLDRPVPGTKNTFEKIPGVTTIIRKGLPKEVFTRYAGTATAEFAVNHWDELAEMAPADRLKRINGGRYENRDAAADRGQETHEIARQLSGGAEVPVPEEIAGYVRATVRFLDEFDVQPIAEELLVFSETHYYCGRLDIAASVEIPDLDLYDWIPRDDDGRARGLFDYKSSPSGIYGELGLQLAPYKYAEYAMDEHDEITEVPKVDFAAGVHLRRDGTYSVIPVACGPDEFDDFLAIKRTAEVADRVNELVMSEITPPLSTRYRMTPIGDSDD
jgi:hypothetical protein